MKHFQHKTALVESEHIGKRTRVWANAHILPDAKVGEDCNICDHTFIENDVIVGDRVTVKCGVQLWDATRVEDDVFIGPNATFTNDKFVRSQQHPDEYCGAYLEKGCSIGANATILPGIRVGKLAMVGAGSVVTQDIPAYAIVSGNPARIEGYVSNEAQMGKVTKDYAREIDDKEYFSGAKLIGLSQHSDIRGDLSVAEVEDNLPFQPQRIFTMYNVPNKYVRGEYALKNGTRLVVCQKGSVNVMFDDGENRRIIILDDPRKGLLLPPMVWSSFFKFTEDTILMTIASSKYNSDDYIRNYDDFLKS